jgi:hypothetical protein
VSTRVGGAEPPVILITAKATMAAGTTCLCLTVTPRGVLDKSHIHQASSGRRLVIEATYPLGRLAASGINSTICY